jgi:hypothetical protein
MTEEQAAPVTPEVAATVEVPEAPKKKVGRPRKGEFRPGILTKAQVDALRTPQQVLQAEFEASEAERKRRDAERKRAERAEQKVRDSLSAIESKEDLWAANRSLLSESELSALSERQERALDQLHWMDSVLAGNNLPPDDPDYVSLEEGAADLDEFVKANGTVGLKILWFGDYWRQPVWEKFQGDDPTSIFARLGFVVGFPGKKLHDFEQFIASLKPTAPSGSGFVTMVCECGRIAGQASVRVEIASRYAELGKRFMCYQCREVEHRSRRLAVSV